MKNRLLQCLLVAAMAGASVQAWSANWIGIFKNTPVEDFDDEDMRRMLDVIKVVLGDPAPTDVLSWSNDATGAGGEFKVLGQPRRDGFDTCRRVRFSVHSKRRKGYPLTWTACKDGAGKWVLVSGT